MPHVYQATSAKCAFRVCSDQKREFLSKFHSPVRRALLVITQIISPLKIRNCKTLISPSPPSIFRFPQFQILSQVLQIDPCNKFPHKFQFLFLIFDLPPNQNPNKWSIHFVIWDFGGGIGTHKDNHSMMIFPLKTEPYEFMEAGIRIKAFCCCRNSSRKLCLIDFINQSLSTIRVWVMSCR